MKRALVVLLALVAACGGGAQAVVPRPATNAFIEGGVPHYDPALSRALEALPEIPSDASWLAFRKTALAESLPRLWDAAERCRAGELEIGDVHDMAFELNKKLRAKGLGYFIRAHFEETPRGRVATLRTYTVRDVAIAIVDAHDIAVLELEPMGATVTPGSSGETFHGVPVVHTRAVTGDAVSLVSALSTKRVVRINKPALEAALNTLILGEVQEAIGADVARATAVGELLVRWSTARGAAYLDVEAERSIGPSTSRDLAAIEAELTKQEAGRFIAAVADRIRRRVQLHELQHALDYKSERAFQLSAPLEAVMGKHLDLRGRLLASMELSAWIATFARELSWFDMLTGLAAAHDASIPTGFAFTFIIDSLAQRFDPKLKPALQNGAVDRDKLIANLLFLTERDRGALADASRALWEGWYGTKLEQIELRR